MCVRFATIYIIYNQEGLYRILDIKLSSNIPTKKNQNMNWNERIRRKKLREGKIKAELREKTRNRDIFSGFRDDQMLNSLVVSESLRSWIEEKMFELRNHMTDGEQNVMKYLEDSQITYISQAPFVIEGQVFFADFYLPDSNVIVEVDGGYHRPKEQQEKDQLRDLCFNGVLIKVARISNEATRSANKIRITLSQYIVYKL
jgi:very-short-patch-repair endonuclease